MILAERAARVQAESFAASVQEKVAIAEADAANARAVLSNSEVLIGHLRLEVEKLRRELYGNRSERKARLLEQMELQLEALEAAATEDELAAQKAAPQTEKMFQRRRPSRKSFPAHLPRERIVIPRQSSVRAADRPNCRSWARTSPRPGRASISACRRWPTRLALAPWPSNRCIC